MIFESYSFNLLRTMPVAGKAGHDYTFNQRQLICDQFTASGFMTEA